MIYTNRFINIISFFITVIIFFILNSFLVKFNFNISKISLEDISNIIPDVQTSKENENQEEKYIEEKTIDLGDWYIQIPSISLSAPIAEGTNLDILNTKVGHFEKTATENGNIGLAAHNRGYELNFFENLKNVKKEDEIIYIHGQYNKTYIVDTIEIIQNTDWSYLNKTDENKITLITCVENQPQYRRCVQATSIEN